MAIEKSDSEKKELLNKSELSVWLDTYDDIFSDFDSRPFVDRALSDDFINEARKMAREKTSGKIELNLLMPASLRDHETEEIVAGSLHKHFHHFADQINREMIIARSKGFVMSAAGAALMILAAYIVTITGKNFSLNALHIIMEPSGWFLVWTGLDHIFYISRNRKKELVFNLKMANAEITFLSL